MKYDLHIHTNRSDGIFEPTAVLDLAKQRGLDCISLTDHDTMVDTDKIIEHAKKIGIGYLVGVELSCVSSGEVHILGYNIDYNAPGFAEEMAKIANKIAILFCILRIYFSFSFCNQIRCKP